MRFTLRIWRQDGAEDAGRLERYEIEDVPGDMSLLEMLDLLNEQLTREGQIPVAFDSDCREGICGMSRNEKGLKGLLESIPKLREEFWNDVRIPGDADNINEELEKASRVADFLEFAETMATDALERSESCGGHFREESQTEEGEAKRKDDEFQFVSAWEFTGVGKKPNLHRENLEFEAVTPSQRSYK